MEHYLAQRVAEEKEYEKFGKKRKLKEASNSEGLEKLQTKDYFEDGLSDEERKNLSDEERKLLLRKNKKNLIFL